MNKPRILFIYDHEYEHLWRDGLWAALELLKTDYRITRLNFVGSEGTEVDWDYDFVLGWGGFCSPVDNYLQRAPQNIPKGLCIGGNAFPPVNEDTYGVLFYETEWYKPQLNRHSNIYHAFGVNTDIYKPLKAEKIWDYLTVGAFAYWKRQEKLIEKPGYKLAVGQIQKNNIEESLSIIGPLLENGICVSDMVAPEKLAKIYSASASLYIPADLLGGGERAVLEARACGVDVEVEDYNPKLKELTTSPIWDHHYYADQLKKGILSVL